MALLDIGGGAGSGLETLLARLRLEEEQNQRQDQINETQRSNLKAESQGDTRLQQGQQGLDLEAQRLKAADQTRTDALGEKAQQQDFAQATTRQAGYAPGQDIATTEAAKNAAATGEPLTTNYLQPKMSTLNMIGASSLPGDPNPQPSVLNMSANTLTAPSPTMAWRGTGKELLAAQQEKDRQTKADAPKPPSDEQKYLDIQSRMQGGQPVSAGEAAYVKAYERNKGLGPSASANITTAASDARLDKSEAFTRQEAGRKFLTEKVEAPYNDAKEKADNLRGVVEAAKSGNMVAGSLQPLLATLGVTTMEGVKRINSTELQAVSGAGSLLTRIRGQAGKLTAGQPMAPELQQNLIDLADMLEQSSYTKYKAGYDAATKRYSLDAETPLPGPGAAQSGGKALADPLGIR